MFRLEIKSIYETEDSIRNFAYLPVDQIGEDEPRAAISQERQGAAWNTGELKTEENCHESRRVS